MGRGGCRRPGARQAVGGPGRGFHALRAGRPRRVRPARLAGGLREGRRRRRRAASIRPWTTGRTIRWPPAPHRRLHRRRARGRGAPPPGRGGGGAGRRPRGPGLPGLLPAELPLPDRRLVHRRERRPLRGAGRGAVRRHGRGDAPARAFAAGQGLAGPRPPGPRRARPGLRRRRLPRATSAQAFPRARIAGLDLSPAYLGSRAAAPGAARFVQAKAEQLPFADASLDAVTASTSSTNCRRRCRPVVAAEIARVLKPGGLLRLRRLHPARRRAAPGPPAGGLPGLFPRALLRRLRRADLTALFAEAGLAERARDKAFLTKAVLYEKVG